MIKIVINADFGGFSLSHEAIRRYAELKGITLFTEKTDSEYIPYSYSIDEKGEIPFYDNEIPRDDPALVQTVQELGEAANGNFATLKLTEIPDGVNWYISEYDGLEHVAERHRTWT